MLLEVSLAMLVLSLAPGSQGFQWKAALPDNGFVAGCAGGRVSIPWDFTLGGQESLRKITWRFHGNGQNDKLIAVHSAKTFFTTPEFSRKRVRYLAHGGLVLSNVSKADTGVYSVSVAISNRPGSHVDHVRRARVEVGDGLQVEQQPQAEWSPNTTSHHVQLTCGVFTNHGQPAHDVTWKTPAGESQSSKFQDGRFYLELPNPVKGGKYSCTFPATSTLKSCLSRNANRKAALEVDEVKARLSLVEADGKVSQSRVNNNTRRLDISTRQVSFFARLSSSKSMSGGQQLIPNQALNNVGSAYSPSTGRFTAPFNGTYFLTVQATTGTWSSSSHRYAHLEIRKGNNEFVCGAYSTWANYLQGASCQAVVHLDKGQYVWLRVYTSSGYFWSTGTSFSGFLLRAEE